MKFPDPAWSRVALLLIALSLSWPSVAHSRRIKAVYMTDAVCDKQIQSFHLGQSAKIDDEFLSASVKLSEGEGRYGPYHFYLKLYDANGRRVYAFLATHTSYRYDANKAEFIACRDGKCERTGAFIRISLPTKDIRVIGGLNNVASAFMCFVTPQAANYLWNESRKAAQVSPPSGSRCPSMTTPCGSNCCPVGTRCCQFGNTCIPATYQCCIDGIGCPNGTYCVPGGCRRY